MKDVEAVEDLGSKKTMKTKVHLHGYSKEQRGELTINWRTHKKNGTSVCKKRLRGRDLRVAMTHNFSLVGSDIWHLELIHYRHHGNQRLWNCKQAERLERRMETRHSVFIHSVVKGSGRAISVLHTNRLR